MKGRCVATLGAAALFAMSAYVPSVQASSGPEVTVGTGTLVGVKADGVLAFKGIPFAAPPVGKLRWRPPQPAAAWSGVRDAKTYGNECMQVAGRARSAPLRAPLSEDCLYLNVWRPANEGKNLPVMGSSVRQQSPSVLLIGSVGRAGS